VGACVVTRAGRVWSSLREFATEELITLGLIAVTLVAVSQAVADDRGLCFDQNSPVDTGIAACGALIASGKAQGNDLAALHDRRAYFYLKKGEGDRALADLSEAIRLHEDHPGIWSWFGSNFAVILTLFVAVVGWYLTYRGWHAQARNNRLAEQQKHQNAIDLESRKFRLNFVSDQIRYLYGPLMALGTTRRATFDALMARNGGERESFFDGAKRTPEELRQWRLWRTEVLMPLVEKMQEVILQNAHLIVEVPVAKTAGVRERQAGSSDSLLPSGKTMPVSFHKLMEHAAAYKAVLKNWAQIIEKRELDASGVPMIDAQHQVKEKDSARLIWEPVVPHTAHENFPDEIIDDVTKVLEKLRTTQAELLKSIEQHPVPAGEMRSAVGKERHGAAGGRLVRYLRHIAALPRLKGEGGPRPTG
jgi:hypothetical protein